VITVEAVGDLQWIVTRYPTWLGRLFRRKPVRARVRFVPAAGELRYITTNRRVPSWVWRAIEQEPVHELPVARTVSGPKPLAADLDQLAREGRCPACRRTDNECADHPCKAALTR
jgi:hypothetical protein